MSIFGAYAAWLKLTSDSCRLGLEAQAVIGLRLARLARGDLAAVVEANRMVSEKMVAAAEVQMKAASAMLTGDGHAIPARTVSHYRRKVRANRRRLGRKRAR